jgi:para-nitrobenzyl esterase
MSVHHWIAALAATALAVAVDAQVVDQRVPSDPLRIDSGLVAGKVLPSGVKAYLGIPYAAPPVRELRWRDPQPVQPWKGVYNADRKGARMHPGPAPQEPQPLLR